MKKIRTIICTYNGERHIEEQIRSIIDQQSLKDYEHQIFVYDDNSHDRTIEIIDNMHDDKIHIIKNTKPSKGVFLNFTEAILDAIESDVDYVFLADQDDVFYKNKYYEHITFHKQVHKALLISGVKIWDSKKDKIIENIFRHRKGMGFSLDLKLFANMFDFKRIIAHAKQQDHKFYLKYHDTFLLHICLFFDQVFYLEKLYSLNRVNDTSETHDKQTTWSKRKIWANDYDYYFDFLLPIFKRLKIKISINKFNKLDYILNNDIATFIRWKLNNFAMYIRAKFFRNLVGLIWQLNQYRKTK